MLKKIVYGLIICALIVTTTVLLNYLLGEKIIRTSIVVFWGLMCFSRVRHAIQRTSFSRMMDKAVDYYQDFILVFPAVFIATAVIHGTFMNFTAIYGAMIVVLGLGGAAAIMVNNPDVNHYP